MALPILSLWRCVHATLAITEERALLRAAQKVEAAGGSRFEIVSRDDIRSSVANTMYGQTVSVTQLGFESRLDVRVRQADGECWRCLNAADVRARLEPLYPN